MNSKLKEAKCIDCEKIIYIDKRASNKRCRCEECKKNHHKPSDIRFCKICGKQYYKHEGGCSNEFCKKHGLEQFKTLIKYFTFDKNKLGTNEVQNEFYRVRNLLYDLYWEQQLSGDDIGKIFGYNNSHNILQSIFSYLNIPTRNLNNSVKIAYLKGKLNIYGKNQYNAGWHTTWNEKEVYLRSSYELDYAKELDKQKIDYDVEKFHIKYFDTQRQEFRCAIPDFYLNNTNTIVEIKSSWTLDKQNMIDKFKVYKELGYNCKLICDHKEIEL